MVNRSQDNVSNSHAKGNKGGYYEHVFNDKAALVTGAGSGIGLATARAFAEAGAAVALIEVHENAVHSATEELNSAGYRAIAVCCNVAAELIRGIGSRCCLLRLGKGDGDRPTGSSHEFP
jgi:hypothetical protein